VTPGKGFAVRLRIWSKSILFGAPLFDGLTAFAQFGTPTTPAPYNPVALGEVTGAPREAVGYGTKDLPLIVGRPSPWGRR